MLVRLEHHCYNIAYSAATKTSFSSYESVCYACKGCGLLPHPDSYMHIAECLVCHGSGLLAKELVDRYEEKKKLTIDMREHCNAGSKTISA